MKKKWFMATVCSVLLVQGGVFTAAQAQTTKDIELSVKRDSIRMVKEETRLKRNAQRWNFSISTFSLHPGIEKESKKKWRKSMYLGQFKIGWVNGLDMPQGMDLKMKSSHDWSLDVLGLDFTKKHHTLSAGIGFQHTVLSKSNTTSYFTRDEDRKITLANFNPASTNRVSKLILNSNYLKLGYKYKFNQKWSVSLSSLFHYQWKAKIKNKYTLDNKEYTVREKNVQTNPFLFTMVAGVFVHNAGLYVSYTPTKALKFSNGEDGLKQFSVGFSLGF